MYLISTAFLLLAVFSLTLLPRLHSWRKRYDHFINAVVTVLATVAGLLLALHLSRLESERAEREQVARLVQTAIREIDLTGADLGSFYTAYAIWSPGDSSFAHMLRINVPPVPTVYSNLLTSELFLRNVSAPAYGSLVQERRSLAHYHQILQEWSYDDVMAVKWANRYGALLSYTKQVLEIESHRLQGQLDEAELPRRLSEAEKSMYGQPDRSYPILPNRTRRFARSIPWQDLFAFVN